jgi:MFS transporter, DHA2 family, methylenomycin A resistance protein
MTYDVANDAAVATATIETQKRVLAATSLSYVIVILDTSIVNVALEPIAGSFGSDIAGLQWLVTAYTLTFASLLLSGGSLGDRLGARNVYLAGLLTFALASALCGIAPTLPVLVLARVVQGVGAALLVPCSLNLINMAYPDAAKRADAIGVWAGCGGVAMAAGPLVGGLLIHLLGWRSIFLVNVPIAVAGAWLTTRVAGTSPTPSLRRIDIVGQITAIVAIGASVAALIEGPKLGLQSDWIRACILTAAVAWVLFVVAEARGSEPMMPLGFFRDPVFSAAVLISLASALVFYGLFFLLSLYFQNVRGLPPLQTGLSFLPLTAMVTLGSFISGSLSKRFGARLLVCGSFLLYSAGFAGLIALADDASYWRIALCFPAVGLAAGIITPAATSALMGVVAKARMGVATGVLNASRQTGSAFGVAIFGAMMSAIEPVQSAIFFAVCVAIGVSLVAALVWSVALGSAAGREASDA